MTERRTHTRQPIGSSSRTKLYHQKRHYYCFHILPLLPLVTLCTRLIRIDNLNNMNLPLRLRFTAFPGRDRLALASRNCSLPLRFVCAFLFVVRCNFWLGLGFASFRSLYFVSLLLRRCFLLSTSIAASSSSSFSSPSSSSEASRS